MIMRCTHALTTSLPTKTMFLLSIILCAITKNDVILPQAYAFVPPTSTWQTAQNNVISQRQGARHEHRDDSSSSRRYKKLVVLPTNHHITQPILVHDTSGAVTKLYAEPIDNDNEDDDGMMAQSSPKAIHKGAQPSPAAESKGGPSKKITSTQRKSLTKKSATKRRKKKQQKSSSLKKTAKAKQLSSLATSEEEDDGASADYTNHIPTTGYSLADRLEKTSAENQEIFETTLTPLVTGIQLPNGDDEEIVFEYDEDGFPIGFQAVVKDDEEDGDEYGEGNGRRRRHEGVARIDTVSSLGNVGEEPVRWIVSLGESADKSDDDGGDNGDNTAKKGESFAMIDVPPYSDTLVDEIRAFMDPNYNATTSSDDDNSGNPNPSSSLDVILITNQQCIHYDKSPGVYVTRKSDLTKWKAAFPNVEVVMYRLDIPRECREEVMQVLDGYGPWGWKEEEEEREEVIGNGKFVETGRPLTIEEWDEDTKNNVLTKGELPPDDQVLVADDDNGSDSNSNSEEDEEEYSPEAIRQREETHRLLAIYTPGHTFGSVTYVFPQRGICCSGYTLPLETSAMPLVTTSYGDDRNERSTTTTVSSTTNIPPQGPRLDYQGYLATSASRPRQMSSALSLINTYIDRFRVVLPARGDVVFLDTEEQTRKRELMESVGLYRKMSDIYGRLGITE